MDERPAPVTVGPVAAVTYGCNDSSSSPYAQPGHRPTQPHRRKGLTMHISDAAALVDRQLYALSPLVPADSRSRLTCTLCLPLPIACGQAGSRGVLSWQFR